MLHGYVTQAEGAIGDGETSWQPWFKELAQDKRATQIEIPDGPIMWVAAERVPQFESVYPESYFQPKLAAPARFAKVAWEPEKALIEIFRGRMEGLGPIVAKELALSSGLAESVVAQALYGLENQGFIFQGKYSPGTTETEWCERRLLARIHKYTLNKLRAEIQPVSTQDFMRFLFSWHRLSEGDRLEGPHSLQALLDQLEGFEAPAAAWEGEILPLRLKDYDPAWLDVLFMSGRFVWGRLRQHASNSNNSRTSGPIRTSPIALVSREHYDAWAHERQEAELSSDAAKALEFLKKRGASFFDDIARATRLLKTQTETALGEWFLWGL